MNEQEKEFFSDMRESVKNDVLQYGLENIKSWKVTEKGISAILKSEEPELNLEEGSAEVTLTDVYAMFYLLLEQNQKLNPGSKMMFDLKAFENLPKKVAINFLADKEKGKLLVWIPEKRKKSKLILPQHKIVTVN